MRKQFTLAILIIPLFLSLQTAGAATLIDTSSNWSGYSATTGSFTAVGGSWSVPQATGASAAALSADATWVGIGGVSGKDLIQAGTQNIVQNGTTTYEAWYELLPASPVQVPLAVHPGDAVTVSIAQQTDGQWQISFNDATTGQSYQTSVTYASSLSSAEWIEEMPSDQRGPVPLDNFGSVSFSGGFAVQNGARVSISGSGAASVTMTMTGGQVLAAPSALGADGASFTVTRTAATYSSSPATTTARTGRWSRTGIDVQGYVPLPRSSQSFSSSSFHSRRAISSQGNRGFFSEGARRTVIDRKGQ